MGKIKIAVIGVGSQGKVHLEALQELVLNDQIKIAGVCDLNDMTLSKINCKTQDIF